MMKCSDAARFVDGWELGTLDTASLAEFRKHMEGCPDCARDFGALLPFILRDASDTAFIGFTQDGNRVSEVAAASSREFLPEGFVDEVMAKIEPARGRIIQWPVFRPALLAAAAAILVVGIGIGGFFASRNSNVMMVQFMLEAPTANRVQLVGDFSKWDPQGYELSRSAPDAPWVIRIPLEKGKAYTYNFIIDESQWVPDPKAPARIDDGFGGSGSLLRL
jgi:hypothetical protein